MRSIVCLLQRRHYGIFRWLPDKHIQHYIYGNQRNGGYERPQECRDDSPPRSTPGLYLTYQGLIA